MQMAELSKPEARKRMEASALTWDALEGEGQDDEGGDIEEGEPLLDPVQRGVEQARQVLCGCLRHPGNCDQDCDDGKHPCNSGSTCQCLNMQHPRLKAKGQIQPAIQLSKFLQQLQLGSSVHWVSAA